VLRGKTSIVHRTRHRADVACLVRRFHLFRDAVPSARVGGRLKMLTRVNPFFSNEKPGRRSLSDSNTRRRKPLSENASERKAGAR
jgi:hypothetical protein